MAYTHKLSSLSSTVERSVQTKLLLVGPKDTQLGGAKATFGVFHEELTRRDTLQIDLISSGAPPDVYNNKHRLINSETVRRTAHVIWQYLRHIRKSDVVLVFSNNSFTIALVPVLLVIAKLYRKPFFHKPIGGDLDTDLTAQNRLVRRYIVSVLNKTDGVFAQTRLLQKNLRNLGCAKVYYLPGCRPRPVTARPDSKEQRSPGLRLVFLSQIKKEKGPFYLLDAMRKIAMQNPSGISCDFYGPIFDEDRAQFMEHLNRTPNTRYCGIVDMEKAIPVIREYDALVLPTYYACEGHPGAIIEAMLAGVPIISTTHRSIPELVEDGINGLLVPPHDVDSLIDAIASLAQDKSLIAEMGAQSEIKSQQFWADVVVSKALNFMNRASPAS